VSTGISCYAYPEHCRLRRHAEFQYVQKQGRRISNRLFAVYVRNLDQPQQTSRFGITVSKRVARLAVYRNLLRRRIREILRLNRPSINCGQEIVVIARSAAPQAEFGELRQALLSLFEKNHLMSPDKQGGAHA